MTLFLPAMLARLMLHLYCSLTFWIVSGPAAAAYGQLQCVVYMHMPVEGCGQNSIAS